MDGRLLLGKVLRGLYDQESVSEKVDPGDARGRQRDIESSGSISMKTSTVKESLSLCHQEDLAVL